MPKAGFKSMTVSEDVYNELQKSYNVLKPTLSLLGINSFSAFVTFSTRKLFKDPKVFQAFVDSMDAEHKALFEKLRNVKHA